MEQCDTQNVEINILVYEKEIFALPAELFQNFSKQNLTFDVLLTLIDKFDPSDML